MKIVRAKWNEECFYAVLDGDVLRPLKGEPFEQIVEDGRRIALEKAQLLAPCRPGKVVAVGLNYLDHIKEMNDPMPDEPVIFIKPASAVIGPDEAIVCPRRSSRVDYEAELEADPEAEDWLIYGAFDQFSNIQKFLEDKGVEIVSSEFERIPTDYKEVTQEQREAIEKLLDKFEEDEDVQNVFHNMKED